MPSAVSSQLMTCPHCGRAGFTLIGLAVHHCAVKRALDLQAHAQRSSPPTPPPLQHAAPVITRSALTRWLETGSLPPPPTATTFYLRPHQYSRP